MRSSGTIPTGVVSAAGGAGRDGSPFTAVLENSHSAPANAAAPITATVIAFERMASILEDRRRSRPDHLRKLRRVPVRQTDAAMRLRASDHLGFGRAVDAVMVLRQIDPRDAHGSVRSRRHCAFPVRRIGIPEEPGVVVKWR